MDQATARQERRALKQKLFTIRRYVEGENVTMTTELIRLKANFEQKQNFTSWSDFPESWDVGDPHRVKEGAYAFDERDSDRFRKIAGKDLFEIVIFDEV